MHVEFDGKETGRALRSVGGARLSRRQFLGRASLAVGISLALPAVIRSQTPGRKLNLGLIGVGGQGATNLKSFADENIVALCDVNETVLNATGQQYPQAKRYRDFRKLLEQADLEAVVVSTADHTHAVASMMAIRSGKHVYCEKPLTHSVYEARVIAQAARDHKVATQMGNICHAADGYRELIEWLQAGAIGAVTEAHCWTDRPLWPQGLARFTETPPVPPDLDWDLWLGPAPFRPYHPEYQPFKWRGWWDFGTGALGDMGCHIMDAPYWALHLGAPSIIEAESSGINTETAPKWSVVRYTFPARGNQPPVKLTWYDGGKLPPPELVELVPAEKNGSLLVGPKGRLFIPMGGAPRLVPAALMNEFKAPDRTLARSPGHIREWVDACKGGKPAGSCFDYAGPLTEAVLLGNVALRTGKSIEWDAASLKAANVPEAAPFIRREYRQGWTL